MKFQSLVDLIKGAEGLFSVETDAVETLDNVHESDRAGYEALRKYGAKFLTKDGRITDVVFEGGQIECVPESALLLFPDYDDDFYTDTGGKKYTMVAFVREMYRAMKELKASGLLENPAYINNLDGKNKFSREFDAMANHYATVQFRMCVCDKRDKQEAAK